MPLILFVLVAVLTDSKIFRESEPIRRWIANEVKFKPKIFKMFYAL